MDTLFAMFYKPEALSNWIANEVSYDTKSKITIFTWNDSLQQTQVVEVDEKYHILVWERITDMKQGEQIRFQVTETEVHTELLIEDRCEIGEEERFKEKWDKMIHRMAVVGGFISTSHYRANTFLV